MYVRSLAGLSLLCVFARTPLNAQVPRVASVDPKEVRLNSDLLVGVKNLEILLQNNPSGQQPPLIPFIDGYPMKGSTLRYIDADSKIVRFTLARNPADPISREAWNHVLSGIGPFKRDYVVSVGEEGKAPIPSEQKLTLEVYHSPWSYIAFTLLIVLISIFLILVFKSNILKDPPPPPQATLKDRKYSLGRFQMAWWFFIVLGSFTIIWLITGEVAMPGTSLMLMGISAATALSAVGVKSNPAKPTDSSKPRFFSEMLGSGSDAITLPRFQMAAWTLILGLTFIAGVVTQLSQPILDVSLLTLMGISSGTYIGFKFNEKDSP